MKTLMMSLAAFGTLGCSLALAEPASPLPLGGEAKGAFVLLDAQMDAVRGGAAPTGSRSNSKSTNYYTDYSYEYNPETGSYDYVQGDTYKTTSKSNYSYQSKVVNKK